MRMTDCTISSRTRNNLPEDSGFYRLFMYKNCTEKEYNEFYLAYVYHSDWPVTKTCYDFSSGSTKLNTPYLQNYR